MSFVSLPHGQTGALDALLASYAAGALSRPLHALVASHLSIKADSRMFVSALEELQAEELEYPTTPIADLAENDRDRRLAAIFPMSAVEADDSETGAMFLPNPLRSLIGMSYEALPWRTVMPGLRNYVVEASPGCEAEMLWIKAGRAMPSHTHPGVEATLVLKGSFSDASGHYSRGDLAVVDSDVDHKPIAGQDEDCICFAVSEGPVRLTGPIARLFQKLIRH